MTKQLYITKGAGGLSGNVIYVDRIADGRAYLNQVGYTDREGESFHLPDQRWAVVAEDWPRTAIDSGVLTPVVKTMGGNWRRESEFDESQIARDEVRIENTFEELQRKTRRGRDTLNAY